MKRFWPYIKGLKYGKHFYVWGIFFGIIFGVSSGAGIPGMVKYVFPRIFSDESSMEVGQLVLVALAIPIVFALRGLSGYLSVYFINKGGILILEELRSRYYRKLLDIEVGYFNKNGLGDLVSRMTADFTIIQQAFTESAVDVIKQPLQLVGGLGFMVILSILNPHFSMMLAALLVIPICVVPVQAFGKKLFKKVKTQQEELGDISQMVSDAVLGGREIRIFNAEDRFFGNFASHLKKFVHTQIRVVAYYHALSPTIEIITVFGVSIALIVAYFLKLSLSDLLSIMAALYLCYEPVKKLGVLNSRFERGKGALERIEEVTEMPVAIKNPENPVSLHDVKGEIRFDDVSFAYGDEPTLDQISFMVKPGEKVAVVGPSGAGKSTLIQLIPRFYDVEKGKITIDSKAVQDVSLTDLRDNIAVVLQEPVLFSGTFLENLKLGKPDASTEEIIEATKKAFIHDFILSLPNGYDTQAGERGLNLSGGQKQRIALARAFLRKAPILIMDEATSALDSESEEKIQLALGELFKDVTALIIAHRFSSIRFVDRIIVLEDGKLVGNGTHNELMQSNTLYQKLYNNQIQA